MVLTSLNWLTGLQIPIKAVMDGMNDGVQVRDIHIIYHIYYQSIRVINNQEVVSTQVTINDVASDALCHATGDPHYITFDQGR